MYMQNITLLMFLCCFHAEGICLTKLDVKLHVKKFWVKENDGENF